VGEEQLSKHERRQLKLQMKREAKDRMHHDFQKTESNKNLMIYGVIAVIVIAGIALFLSLPKPEPVNLVIGGLTFPLGAIHWHATPLISVCGENIPIPVTVPGRHLGTPLLHTHEDKQIHIEGNVSSPSEITLGLFMANVGMKFSSTKLIDKSNGDVCSNGQVGQVKLLVNGVENNEFENYVIREGNTLEMKFE